MSFEIVSKFLIRQGDRRMYSLDLVLQKKMLLFHKTQLTKLDGSAYYAAFFTFYAQNEENKKFEPNALILVARHYHIKQLKSALMLLYDKHVIGKKLIAIICMRIIRILIQGFDMI